MSTFLFDIIDRVVVSVLPMGVPGYVEFHWNTGQTTQNISVTQSGYYYVNVKDAGNCLAGAGISVSVIIGNEKYLLSINMPSDIWCHRSD